MKTNYEMVREFHQKFGLVLNDIPTVLDFNSTGLRWDLITEEANELYHELFTDMVKDHSEFGSQVNPQPNLTHVAKELADLLYVVYGTAAAYGIPIDDVFAEVHRSNMSKLDSDGKVIRRADGKVLKGKNYTPANVEGVLKAHSMII